MVLRKEYLTFLILTFNLNLHSNMVLLKVVTFPIPFISVFEFTFQYGTT